MRILKFAYNAEYVKLTEFGVLVLLYSIACFALTIVEFTPKSMIAIS